MNEEQEVCYAGRPFPFPPKEWLDLLAYIPPAIIIYGLLLYWVLYEYQQFERIRFEASMPDYAKEILKESREEKERERKRLEQEKKKRALANYVFENVDPTVLAQLQQD